MIYNIVILMNMYFYFT